MRKLLFVVSIPFFMIGTRDGAASLTEELAAIRQRVSQLEQGLVDDSYSEKSIKAQIKKIKTLIRFQRLEKKLSRKRLAEIEHTVTELEARHRDLNDQIALHEKRIKKYLMAIEISSRDRFVPRFRSLHLPDQEKLEAPKRRVLSNLVDKGFKELEGLRIDLADATQLGNRIQDEKHQLNYLIQDLKEQEGVLELNRQLQDDILKKKRRQRLVQLKHYRKLKTSEGQVENLIKSFNARKELESVAHAEKRESQTMRQGRFIQQKGKLPFPVQGGTVVTEFGKVFDAKSGLFIFKKGLNIQITKDQPVRAISAGRIAFAGVLPNYGQVVIIDHGDHFYSLCAHLEAISKRTNESVAAGDTIGSIAGSGDPLYFEIRSRNVAVNPLQWVFN